MYSKDDLTNDFEDINYDNPSASWEVIERVIANVLLPEYKQHLIAEEWDKFRRENCERALFKQ
jgi:hypothetical protein